MKEKKSIADEIYSNKDKMAKELDSGSDILLKKTPNGLKIQALEVKTLK